MFLLWGFPGWWDDLICVYFEGKHHLRKGDGGGAGAFVTVNTPSAELGGGGGRRGFVFDGRQAGSSWHPGKRAIWRVDTPTHLPVKNVDSPWYRAHRLARHSRPLVTSLKFPFHWAPCYTTPPAQERSELSHRHSPKICCGDPSRGRLGVGRPGTLMCPQDAQLVFALKALALFPLKETHF